MPREKEISSAYALQVEAGSTVDGKLRTHAFTLAAEAFSKSAKNPRNSKKERTTFYARAGHCFSQADQHKQAAMSYVEALLWTQAAVHYQKARMLDEAVSIVMAHRDDIDPTIGDKVVKTARYTYLSQERLVYVSSFHTLLCFHCSQSSRDDTAKRRFYLMTSRSKSSSWSNMISGLRTQEYSNRKGN